MSKVYHSFQVIRSLRGEFPTRENNLKIYRHLCDSQKAVVKKRKIDLDTLYERYGQRRGKSFLARNASLTHPRPTMFKSKVQILMARSSGQT